MISDVWKGEAGGGCVSLDIFKQNIYDSLKQATSIETVPLGMHKILHGFKSP